jgi:NAD+ synthase
MNETGIIEYIVNWLSTYNQSSNTKGFVIGISGGIDSAVTSTLAAKTGLPLLCVEMPIHQDAKQVTRANDHIAWLKTHYSNVTNETLALTSIFDAFIAAVPQSDEEAQEMSLVNTRARLRMTTLYYFAALKGMLVLGTGNKVEDFGIGFFTKYGDGGVDISPIADLNKTQVFGLGKSLGIIESIQTAAPTDGLWGDDRTDEDQIGATYPELEWAMDFKGDVKTLNTRQLEVLGIYNRLNRANQHKMLPIPICIIPEALR